MREQERSDVWATEQCMGQSREIQKTIKKDRIRLDRVAEVPQIHSMTNKKNTELDNQPSKNMTETIKQSTASDLSASAGSVPTSKIVQITTMFFPHNGVSNGNCNKLVALCEDGSLWEQWHSIESANVPDNGEWFQIHSQNTKLDGGVRHERS